MYFLRRGESRGASTGLVQQTVQIVASHDLTLVVRARPQYAGSRPILPWHLKPPKRVALRRIRVTQLDAKLTTAAQRKTETRLAERSAVLLAVQIRQ